MATKKQKHAEGLARRRAFEAEQREIGRRAIEAGRREREAQELKSWEKGHEKHFKFVDECPHCKKIKKNQAETARLAAIEKVAAAAKAAHERAGEPKDAIVLKRSEPVQLEGVDPIHQPFSNKVDA